MIELFELFSDLRMGITVADVASSLKMPQSSTSALLHSLHTLGYLSVDREGRTYAPTSRVALLGLWIEPALVREGPIIKMMRAISEEVGYDSFLATRNKLHVQVIYRQNAAIEKSHSQTGAGGFLALAATGHILMSDMSDLEVINLVTATNVHLPGHVSAVNPRELLGRLAEVRRCGYFVGPSQRSHDKITIAVRMPKTTLEQMALGLSVPEEQLGAEPEIWARLLQSHIAKWLGERTATG
ncbi:MAG: helix-turn-helix domain-containing protein [Novosphingobium sp.]